MLLQAYTRVLQEPPPPGLNERVGAPIHKPDPHHKLNPTRFMLEPHVSWKQHTITCRPFDLKLRPLTISYPYIQAMHLGLLHAIACWQLNLKLDASQGSKPATTAISHMNRTEARQPLSLTGSKIHSISQTPSINRSLIT